ncbi:MAG: hypothetical protein ABL985_04815 [Casimicrobium sp.]
MAGAEVTARGGAGVLLLCVAQALNERPQKTAQSPVIIRTDMKFLKLKTSTSSRSKRNNDEYAATANYMQWR